MATGKAFLIYPAVWLLPGFCCVACPNACPRPYPHGWATKSFRPGSSGRALLYALFSLRHIPSVFRKSVPAKQQQVFPSSFTPTLFFFISFLIFSTTAAQSQSTVSQVWIADNGNGTYKNPILHADYSDPDAIRVGDDFYMTASSFEDVPGLPILHSKDLINWNLIGHALPKLIPEEHFSTPRHGEGVWAPAIRFHKGEFYIYYPDPDFGIYLTKAKKPAGPWSEPLLVQAGKGLIDPCPLWDDDGRVYLVHAFAGSRAGIKSILVVKQLNAEGTRVLDNGVLVYDGHEKDPTVEGPKFYKRNGYYYIFAPAGGVTNGWQIVLRSKTIYGPYERKVVLAQGNTPINGPHQGAWVTTSTGEDWFLHFQDKGAYGRVVHLQPMTWKNDWPVIGDDKEGNGTGQPFLIHTKPNVGKSVSIATPPESDEFSDAEISKQWQWPANPHPASYFLNPSAGTLRLNTQPLPAGQNLWTGGQVLQQKFPAETFVVTTKMKFSPNKKLQNEKAGLTVMGLSYAGLALKSTATGLQLVYLQADDAEKGSTEKEIAISTVSSDWIYLRLHVTAGAVCRFSYSLNGKDFFNSGQTFTAQPGRWKGAKFGLFATRNNDTNDAGYADFDWLHVESTH